MKLKEGAALCAILGSAVISMPGALADDTDMVDHRRHIMKTMGEQMAAIQLIAQKKAPAENLPTHLRILAITAGTALKAFEPNAAGGEAKANVWTHWKDFSGEMNKLVASAAELSKATGEGGALGAQLKAVDATCTSCHETYRAEEDRRSRDAAHRPQQNSAKSAARNDQDVIAYRQHIMTTLNEQTAILGQMLSMAIPTDDAAAHVEVIASTASIALKAYEPRVPGGEAKPNVWTDWSDFSQRMQEFATKSAAAAQTASKASDAEWLSDILVALPCKSCHDVYRSEK